MELLSVDHEFIIVDDGSRAEVQRALAQHFEGTPGTTVLCFDENRGRGAAIEAGIRNATREYACVIDLDLEIPAYSIFAEYLEASTSGADMVIAERSYVWPPNLRAIVRNICSKAYRALAGRVVGLAGLDSESGSKMFRRASVLKILDGVHDARFFWDTEIVAEALRAGQKVTQVPVVVKRRLAKTSSVRVARDTRRYLTALMAYRRRCRNA